VPIAAWLPRLLITIWVFSGWWPPIFDLQSIIGACYRSNWLPWFRFDDDIYADIGPLHALNVSTCFRRTMLPNFFTYLHFDRVQYL
jgi:hypothetical protein